MYTPVRAWRFAEDVNELRCQKQSSVVVAKASFRFCVFCLVVCFFSKMQFLLNSETFRGLEFITFFLSFPFILADEAFGCWCACGCF